QVPERVVEAKHGVSSAVLGVAEEPIANALLAELFEGLGAVGQHHVIEALEGVARGGWVRPHHVEVLLEGALPVLAAELVKVLALGHEGNDLASVVHGESPRKGARYGTFRRSFPERQGLLRRNAPSGPNLLVA